jgi:saxitoxin biosynthesis operon SxtJ-like protein
MGHESFQRDEKHAGSSNRVFGLVFAVVFAIVALVPLLSHGSPRVWALIVAGAFLLVALLLPAALAPLNRLWGRFGLLLHKVTSPLVLGFLFFLVITPMGMLMRLFGKDPLRLRRDAESKSYWIERKPAGPAPESFVDQF